MHRFTGKNEDGGPGDVSTHGVSSGQTPLGFSVVAFRRINLHLRTLHFFPAFAGSISHIRETIRGGGGGGGGGGG